MGDFTDKVGLVTGGGRGIGRSAAIEFGRGGATLGVLDINADDAQRTATEIETAGGRAIAVAVDVASEESVVAAIAEVVDAFGGLDFALNNAGVTGATTPIKDLSVEDWDRTLRINLTGVFLCMKHEIPRLLERGGGAITNTASNAGLASVPGMPDYVSSKHGVVGLTRSAARDLAKDNIRVNAVCPGPILTPLMEEFIQGEVGSAYRAAAEATTPMGRMGDSEEVANAAVWLTSDRASYITGQALSVDGGRRS